MSGTNTNRLKTQIQIYEPHKYQQIQNTHETDILKIQKPKDKRHKCKPKLGGRNSTKRDATYQTLSPTHIFHGQFKNTKYQNIGNCSFSYPQKHLFQYFGKRRSEETKKSYEGRP